MSILRCERRTSRTHRFQTVSHSSGQAGLRGKESKHPSALKRPASFEAGSHHGQSLCACETVQRMRTKLRQLKTWQWRVLRDLRRQVPQPDESLKRLLVLCERLHAQKNGPQKSFTASMNLRRCASAKERRTSDMNLVRKCLSSQRNATTGLWA